VPIIAADFPWYSTAVRVALSGFAVMAGMVVIARREMPVHIDNGPLLFVIRGRRAVLLGILLIVAGLCGLLYPLLLDWLCRAAADELQSRDIPSITSPLLTGGRQTEFYCSPERNEDCFE
jgi:hypothetical protein